MLAALTLALQKFNIEARRGAPGFREQRPRPRKKPQSGRKLPKRLRFGHDSDRSRPTSPESGSFYTPSSTPTFSPFTTPPQSPLMGRKTFSHDDYVKENSQSGLDELVACQPVQSSAYINLSQAQFANGDSNALAKLHNITDNHGLPDPSHSLATSSNGNDLAQHPAVQEEAIVVESLINAYQAPPIKHIIKNQTSQQASSDLASKPHKSTQTTQQLPTNQNSTSLEGNKPNGCSSCFNHIPVEEAPIDVVQVDRFAQAAPLPPGVFRQHQNLGSKPIEITPPTLNNSQPQPTTPMKPPQIDASILSAFNRVQDYFEKHPEHKNLTHEQLVNQLAKQAQADEDKVALDQLGKDHQFLLRRFIEQQDSSDDESFADEKLKSVKKNKTKPTKRFRPADRRPHLGPDWVHSTTQTDDEPEVSQPPERRALRLPTVEDLVASQNKKKLQEKQPKPLTVSQKSTTAPTASTTAGASPKPVAAPQPVGKKAKAAKSYEQLVLELEPLVTPVVPSTAAGGASAAPGERAHGQGSLWRDVWGSWGVWLIARFSATGQGGDVNEASSSNQFNKDEYIKQRPTDRRLVSEEATCNIATTMPGPTKEIYVSLYRDTLSTPWGFRLQGGLDFKQPLTVQRVFVGSPADQNLQRGDVILRINNTDVTHLTHKQAQDLVKQAGGEVSVVVRRASQEGFGVRTGSPQLVILPAVSDTGFRNRPMEAPSGALGFVPALPKNLYRAPAPQQPTVQSYGQDYRRGGFRVDPVPKAPEPKSMLNKLNQSLNQTLWSPSQEKEEFDFKPVSQLKQNFAPDLRRQEVGPMSTGKIWSRPQAGALPSGLSDPGWTPGQNPGAGWSPVRAPGMVGNFTPTPVVNRHEPPNRPFPINRPQPGKQQGYQVPRIESNEPPAWYGSLRGGGGVRPWEVRAAAELSEGEPLPPPGQQAPVQSSTLSPRQMSGQASPRSPVGPASPRQPAAGGDVNVHRPRVQQMAYGPAGGQEYRQLAPGENADNATVQHLQYNTPIGLYSKSNVEATLRNQTAGQPGEGTMQVQGTGGPGAKKEFDPSRSEVLALLQAEESQRRPRPQPGQPQQQAQGPPNQPQQSARYQEEHPNYQGYVDHSKQSPSMHALEAHVESEAPGGFSDF